MCGDRGYGFVCWGGCCGTGEGEGGRDRGGGILEATTTARASLGIGYYGAISCRYNWYREHGGLFNAEIVFILEQIRVSAHARVVSFFSLYQVLICSVHSIRVVRSWLFFRIAVEIYQVVGLRSAFLFQL